MSEQPKIDSNWEKWDKNLFYVNVFVCGCFFPVPYANKIKADSKNRKGKRKTKAWSGFMVVVAVFFLHLHRFTSAICTFYKMKFSHQEKPFAAMHDGILIFQHLFDLFWLRLCVCVGAHKFKDAHSNSNYINCSHHSDRRLSWS